MDAFKDFWKRYWDFRGITSRRDYWMAVLVNIIVCAVVYTVIFYAGYFAFKISELLGKIIGVVLFIAPMVIIIPSLSMTVRRLHDINRSGWWLLLNLTGIGQIIILIFLCLGSDHNNNKWVGTETVIPPQNIKY